MAERGEGGVVMTLPSCEDSSEIRTDKFINNSTSVEERRFVFQRCRPRGMNISG